ncbi:MAG: DUF4139 domain-containing protein, partial [Pseudomonadota bacterium]
PEVAGAALLGVAVAENTAFEPELFDTPAVAAARAARDRDEAALELAVAELEAVVAEIDALDAQAAFLRSVTGGDTLASAENLLAVSSEIGRQLVQIASTRRALEASLGPLEEGIEALDAALGRSEAALRALRPADETWRLMTLDISAGEAGLVTVRMPGFDPSARWRIGYEARLLEDEGRLELGRNVTVTNGGQPWLEAEVTLSTAALTDALEATEVRRSIASIFEAAPAATLRGSGVAVMEEPMAFASEAAFDSVAEAGVDAGGAVIRYDLPRPVTLFPGSDGVQVALSTLSFPVERYLSASPRFDDTAFIMADFTNASVEPILPGETLVYRDATRVGSGALPFIAAGAEETLGFGPERSIALEVEFLDRQSGDRGIIRGQETREEQIRLRATNLGEETQAVRLRYAVPISQQEDLDVRVDMEPAPDTSDADDLRGVMEWELDLAPGADAEIALTFDLRWPEGQVLNWRP